MNNNQLTGLGFIALTLAAAAQKPAYRFDVNLQSIEQTDCEYHGTETDMGYKNTIAANMPWEEYADSGQSDSVALLYLKFKGITADEGASITATSNDRQIRYARFLGEEDTARILMLFVPATEAGHFDTITIAQSDLGSYQFPAIYFRPHGVYSVQVTKSLTDTADYKARIDSINSDINSDIKGIFD